MWNEEEQENSVEQNDTPYDNDPVRAQARNTAEKAAKQKKEIEDRLHQNIEDTQKKAKAKTERLISDAAEKQKQETLEHLQKSPDDLNSMMQSNFENVRADIVQAVTADTIAATASDVDNAKNVVELPQSAYDGAYRSQYEETARIIDIKTDAGKNADPSKAGDTQSVEGVVKQMSDELKQKGTFETSDKASVSTLNETLDARADWSSYRESRDVVQEEADKAIAGFEGSAKRIANGNAMEMPEDTRTRMDVNMSNMPEEARKKMEAEMAEADKKVKEAAANELIKANVEIEQVQHQMNKLKEEQQQIASEGSTVGIAVRKGPAAAVSHFIRDANNIKERNQNMDEQERLRVLQSKLRETSR